MRFANNYLTLHLDMIPSRLILIGVMSLWLSTTAQGQVRNDTVTDRTHQLREVTITESRRIFDNNTGEFYYDKNKIFLYKEDFEKFQKGLANALSFIETGIEPEPVVVENDFDFDNDRRDSIKTDLDDIDFKF